MARRQLKVVRLLEPEMCTECRFSHMADVELENGTTQRMIYCRRLDCDNWDYSTAEAARSVHVEDADAA